MEINDILNDIKNHLTGNPEVDKQFLVEKMNKYATADENGEIVRGIALLLWDSMSEDERAAWFEAQEKDEPLNLFFEKIGQLSLEEDIDELVNLFDEFASAYGFAKSDEEAELLFFPNPIEYNIFLHYYEGDKEIVMLPENKNYSEFFDMYGRVLFQVGRLDDAKEAFLKALEYNPVGAGPLLGLMKYYDVDRNNEKGEEFAKLILKYGYAPEAIAQSYRFLGYWYYNSEDYETSAALYLLSLVFEDHPSAKIDLSLIDKYLPVKDIDQLSRLKEINIQVGVNPVVLDILNFLHEKAIENEQEYIVAFFDNIIKQLPTPEEIPERLAILEDNYDEILNFT